MIILYGSKDEGSGHMNILFRIRFEGDNYRNNGGSYVKVCKDKRASPHLYSLFDNLLTSQPL